LKSTLAAGVAVAGTRMGISSESGMNTAESGYDSKGLPTVLLGSTGVAIPRIAIGLGSRFLNIATLDEALAMCTFALDNGLYYWDTAHTYVNNQTGAVSEERLGHIVKSRRKEIFLSTKISAREADEAMMQIELSMKRLQTDHFDMMKIHAVESPADVNTITKKGGVMDLFLRMKKEGVTRFIGFSGHSSAEALGMMVDTGMFDSMLFAMNHYGNGKDDRQGIITKARSRGMGVMLMKTIRPKETIKDLKGDDLVRYALSVDGPTGIAVGMDSKKVVEANLAILRDFKPMSNEEKMKFAGLLEPFYTGRRLPWMESNYQDGVWI